MLNITIVEKQIGKDLNIKVNFGNEYTEKFGKTDFYRHWNSVTDGNLYNIQMSIYPGHVDILLFEFSPRRLYDPVTQMYIYDLLTIKERQFFKGKGHQIFCAMLIYGMKKGYYDDNTIINVEPNNLYFADSLLDEVPDMDPGTATKLFKRLVEYYQGLGFESIEVINWQDPKYQNLPKMRTIMTSTIGNLLSRCY